MLRVCGDRGGREGEGMRMARAGGEIKLRVGAGLLLLPSLVRPPAQRPRRGEPSAPRPWQRHRSIAWGRTHPRRRLRPWRPPSRRAFSKRGGAPSPPLLGLRGHPRTRASLVRRRGQARALREEESGGGGGGQSTTKKRVWDVGKNRVGRMERAERGGGGALTEAAATDGRTDAPQRLSPVGRGRPNLFVCFAFLTPSPGAHHSHAAGCAWK
jgi:hypothetical protein